jgi:hypothetical protein
LAKTGFDEFCNVGGLVDHGPFHLKPNCRRDALPSRQPLRFSRVAITSEIQSKGGNEVGLSHEADSLAFTVPI